MLFWGAVVATVLLGLPGGIHRPVRSSSSVRLVLLLLLAELRSGQSVLGALQGAARSLPDDRALLVITRVSAVAGLSTAVGYAPTELRPLIAQLARAQRSGASLGGTVRRLLEEDLAAERSRRIARARALPTRLMIPVTLLMLPGIVLLLYAPSLLGLYRDVAGGW